MIVRKMSLLTGLLATLLGLTPTAAAQPATRLSVQVELETPSQRSEAELTAAVAARPSDLSPYWELARSYAASGRRDEAEVVLRQALAVHSNSGAVFSALMTLFQLPADADKMLALAEEWIKVEPANFNPLMLAVKVLTQLGAQARNKPPDAIVYFDRALGLLDDATRQNPQSPLPRQIRVGILMQKAAIIQDPAERDRLLRDAETSRIEGAQMVQHNPGRGAMSPPPPPPPPPPSGQPPSAFPKAVRVGGNVRPPAKIRDVKPQFPAEAIDARVQGVVILEITIDEAGRVAEARVLRSIPLLDHAAVDAVRQWEFTPTLLNGTAVPVIMTATVQFMLPEGR